MIDFQLGLQITVYFNLSLYLLTKSNEVHFCISIKLYFKMDNLRLVLLQFISLPYYLFNENTKAVR